MLPPTEAPEQNVGDPPTPVDGAATCGGAPVGNKPRPTVPRPAAPKPLVLRPATPVPDTSAPEFAAIVELPKLDEGESGETVLPLVAVAVGELGELVTPEVLTELHGINVLIPTPSAPGNADSGEFVKRLVPPPSNDADAVVP
jgi:hypothetical protein